jgi:hypothetical protein
MLQFLPSFQATRLTVCTSGTHDKRTGSGAQGLEFQTQLHHFLSECPWKNCLTSLSLKETMFFICANNINTFFTALISRLNETMWYKMISPELRICYYYYYYYYSYYSTRHISTYCEQGDS